MQASIQNQKNNGLIASSEIRTMRKDLQRLREADVVKESQKIISAKPAPQESLEVQKQRKFLLQKQLQESQAELQKIAKSKEEARIAAEQKSIAAKQEHQRKTLEPLLADEAAGRWVEERKLAKLDETAKQLEEKSAAMGNEKQAILKKAEHISGQLKDIPVSPAMPAPETQKPAAPKTEEEQRRKFLEDIEVWASANKKEE